MRGSVSFHYGHNIFKGIIECDSLSPTRARLRVNLDFGIQINLSEGVCVEFENTEVNLVSSLSSL